MPDEVVALLIYLFAEVVNGGTARRLTGPRRVTPVAIVPEVGVAAGRLAIRPRRPGSVRHRFGDVGVHVRVLFNA